MPNDIKPGADFGSRVRLLRQDRGMTISDLAKVTELTPAAVWQWENRGKLPRRNSLRAVANALGVNPGFFGEGRDEREEAERIPRSQASIYSLEELIRAIEAKGFNVEIKSRGKREFL